MSDEATLAQLRQSLGLLQVAFDAAAEAMVIVEPGGEVRWGTVAADLVDQRHGDSVGGSPAGAIAAADHQ